MVYSHTEWNRNQRHDMYKRLRELYEIPCQRKGRKKKQPTGEEVKSCDDNNGESGDDSDNDNNDEIII